MERTHDPALHDRPEAFDAVGVDRADDVLAASVIDRAAPVVEVEEIVSAVLIRAEQAYSPRYGFVDEAIDGRAVEFGDHLGDDVALALDRANDGRLVGTDTAAAPSAPAVITMPLAGVPVLPLAADECLIQFDDADKLLELLVLQSDANLVAHGPRGFVGAEAHVTLHLQGADALLAGKHEMDHAEPLAQWLVGVLEDRADEMREAVGSALAAVRALPLPSHRL